MHVNEMYVACSKQDAACCMLQRCTLMCKHFEVHYQSALAATTQAAAAAAAATTTAA